MKADVSAEDLINLLAFAPGTKEQKQQFFGDSFQVRVPKTNYDGMYQRLAEQVGRQPALEAILELVCRSASPRLRELLAEGASGREVVLRQSDPRIVDFLFFQNGRLRKAGLAVCEWMQRGPRTGASALGASVVQQSPTPVRTTSRPEVPAHIHIADLASQPSTTTVLSAPRNHGQYLQNVTVSSKRRYLKAPSEWSEADLEDYFVANWNGIDFGLNERLNLRAQQVRVRSETREKVDLVAQTESGLWVAIELKIETADSRDMTQLMSYMQLLATTLNLAADTVQGYLVAPSFQERVLNAAAAAPRVTLLEFLRDD